MSEIKEQYRTVFLDEGSGDSARRSETIDLVVGDTGGEDVHEMTVELRALTVHEYESTGIHPVCLDDNGDPTGPFADVKEQTLINAHRIAKCAYIPDTDELIFTEPEDLRRIVEAPYNASGWVSRLIQGILYVHGFQKIPPDGMQDQRLAEIASAMEQLEAIAKDEGEELDPSQVADIAGRTKRWARHLDHGTEDRTGNATTH